MQVEAIKTGMCDSMYDTLQTLNQQGVSDPLPKKCIEAVSIEVEPSEKKSVAIGRDLTYQHSELDYIYTEICACHIGCPTELLKVYSFLHMCVFLNKYGMNSY